MSKLNHFDKCNRDILIGTLHIWVVGACMLDKDFPYGKTDVGIFWTPDFGGWFGLNCWQQYYSAEQWLFPIKYWLNQIPSNVIPLLNAI